MYFLKYGFNSMEQAKASMYMNKIIMCFSIKIKN